MKKTLGIIGGMGPLATAVLFERIIQLTDASCDQDHLRILIDNNTSIPDRTAFLMGGKNDPYPLVLASLKSLEKIGAEVFIMPCNTAHYCIKTLETQTIHPIVDIIEATTKEIINDASLQEGLGILGTLGLTKFPNYVATLQKHKISCFTLDPLDQEKVSHLIYDIKARGITRKNQAEWENILLSLKRRGWCHFILGCTELSLIAYSMSTKLPFINSIDCLAREAITVCGYPVKKEG